jgi:hypothetical protein
MEARRPCGTPWSLSRSSKNSRSVVRHGHEVVGEPSGPPLRARPPHRSRALHLDLHRRVDRSQRGFLPLQNCLTASKILRSCCAISAARACCPAATRSSRGASPERKNLLLHVLAASRWPMLPSLVRIWHIHCQKLRTARRSCSPWSASLAAPCMASMPRQTRCALAARRLAAMGPARCLVLLAVRG